MIPVIVRQFRHKVILTQVGSIQIVQELICRADTLFLQQIRNLPQGETLREGDPCHIFPLAAGRQGLDDLGIAHIRTQHIAARLEPCSGTGHTHIKIEYRLMADDAVFSQLSGDLSAGTAGGDLDCHLCAALEAAAVIRPGMDAIDNACQHQCRQTNRQYSAFLLFDRTLPPSCAAALIFFVHFILLGSWVVLPAGLSPGHGAGCGR